SSRPPTRSESCAASCSVKRSSRSSTPRPGSAKATPTSRTFASRTSAPRGPRNTTAWSLGSSRGFRPLRFGLAAFGFVEGLGGHDALRELGVDQLAAHADLGLRPVNALDLELAREGLGALALILADGREHQVDLV